MSTSRSEVDTKRSSGGGAAAQAEKQSTAPEIPPGAMRPRMPAPPKEAADADAAGDLRLFHLTGRLDVAPRDAAAGKPLMPAEAASLMSQLAPSTSYPLWLSDKPIGDASVAAPLGAVLQEVLDKAVGGGADLPGIRANLPLLAQQVEAVVSEHHGTLAGQDAVEEVLARFVRQVDVSAKGARLFTEEVERLRRHMPTRGRWLGLGGATLPTLFSSLSQGTRTAQCKAFAQRAHTLAHGLRQLLQADSASSPDAASPKTLTSSLGSMGSTMVDPASMSKTLGDMRGGSQGLGAQRRAALEQALGALDAFASAGEQPAPPLVLCAKSMESGAKGAGRVTKSAAPLDDAAGVFDAEAARLEPVFRAAGLAQLVLAGQYQPEVHDDVIAGMDWRSCSPEELAVLPPVVVLESAHAVLDSQLGALSRLLCGDRPIRVLLTDACSAGVPHVPLSPRLSELALSHRGAFVLQTSLATPQHMVAGLQRAAAAPRPTLAVVGIPDFHAAATGWLQLLVAHHARLQPCFTLDPDGGASWADRLDISANPNPDVDWPVCALECVDGTNASQGVSLPITFASMAALDPAWRTCFKVLPLSAWGDAQQPLVEALAADPNAPPTAAPYIWVVDETGTLQRAVVTRPVVEACLDAARGWHLLAELGGVRNAHVERAVAKAVAEAKDRAQAQQQELAARHQAELDEARRTAGGEAMERLVAVLLNMDNLPAATTPRPAPAFGAAPLAQPTPDAKAAAPAAATAPEPEASFDEAFVDSGLCTTCNECTNINPRLFKYNGDKQAEIVDIKAGTYEDLVKAAEKCPARCIHPGAPQPGDSTATEAMVARAAEFR